MPRPERAPKVSSPPPGVPAPAPSANVDRSPTADQVRELKEALWRFLIDDRSFHDPPRAQEDYRLPNFLRLADALHVIRPSVGRLDYDGH